MCPATHLLPSPRSKHTTSRGIHTRYPLQVLPLPPSGRDAPQAKQEPHLQENVLALNSCSGKHLANVQGQKWYESCWKIKSRGHDFDTIFTAARDRLSAVQHRRPGEEVSLMAPFEISLSLVKIFWTERTRVADDLLICAEKLINSGAVGAVLDKHLKCWSFGDNDQQTSWSNWRGPWVWKWFYKFMLYVCVT